MSHLMTARNRSKALVLLAPLLVLLLPAPSRAEEVDLRKGHKVGRITQIRAEAAEIFQAAEKASESRKKQLDVRAAELLEDLVRLGYVAALDVQPSSEMPVIKGPDMQKKDSGTGLGRASLDARLKLPPPIASPRENQHVAGNLTVRLQSIAGSDQVKLEAQVERNGWRNVTGAGLGSPRNPSAPIQLSRSLFGDAKRVQLRVCRTDSDVCGPWRHITLTERAEIGRPVPAPESGSETPKLKGIPRP